eukprot:CAMPEP_0195036598 /NCGR_PEP_ID=MMETSP0326_2-20130528/72957_1 /TAXON_ID=2866 ORGANISM="Crypthecodinium cohnii, Strain Seligo" /NCGR_SAMPLE_ID=MMETSP0326_2 /ASSEMBLY_ACC=CAM_ASM_000348 /LENGTH=51 /DNA_ID=CAMNT_0040062261 /DNA_START=386 /DNA_END=541 /DNA_ORIENTATION=-
MAPNASALNASVLDPWGTATVRAALEGFVANRRLLGTASGVGRVGPHLLHP